MQNKTRLTVSFLNNLKPNPANTKSTDYEVNLSTMKDSGQPTGVRCLVGKSGGKRFLLRYTSPVTGKKESIGLGKHPETDLATLRKTAKEYRQQIIEGVDPKLERDNQTTEKTMTLGRFFDEVYLPLAKQKRSWKDDVARFRLNQPQNEAENCQGYWGQSRVADLVNDKDRHFFLWEGDFKCFSFWLEAIPFN